MLAHMRLKVECVVSLPNQEYDITTVSKQVFRTLHPSACCLEKQVVLLKKELCLKYCR